MTLTVQIRLRNARQRKMQARQLTAFLHTQLAEQFPHRLCLLLASLCSILWWQCPRPKTLQFTIHFWLCLTCKYSASKSLQDISERNLLISFLLWMQNQVIRRPYPHGRWCTKKIGWKICFGYWTRDRWHFWNCACTITEGNQGMGTQ